MKSVIDLDGLGVRFGRRPILQDLQGSLTGRAIGLLGPNGAGKTTLLHTLLGFHPPCEGTARIFGRDIRTDRKEICELIGYMPENDSFIAGMSAVRLIRMMAELSGLPARLALERAHEALFYVGLGEARYRMLETYSLGMKQLAKLAQAIVHGPKLLFLDEPTNGLDPPHRQRMIRLIRDIRDSGKVRIILSSHLLRDVEECCDEVLILKDGRIAQYCNLEEERRANRKFIEVETLGELGVFADDVADLGCEYALLTKRKIKMVLPEGIEIRQLYEIAARREIQICRLDYKKDSLQDIFLKAMDARPAGSPRERLIVAVYERTYKAYSGPLTDPRSRFRVLPRYAYQDVFSKRLFVSFLVSCFIVPLGLAIMIYLPHNSSFLEIFSEQLGVGGLTFKFDARFFFTFFMVPQGSLSFFMAFIIGPALISSDMRNNALPLYLSRPFSRWDYILGKALVLLVLLSLITWIPGLLLFSLQAYLVGWDWFVDNLRIAVAIVLSSWIYMVLLCLTSLAISAYVKWKPLARLGLFGIFVVSGGLAGILNFSLRTHWGSLLNIGDMVRVVWASLFGVPYWTKTPPLAAWISLLTICAICVALLARKIRAYEVVR